MSWRQVCRRKSRETRLAGMAGEQRPQRVLGPVSLTSLLVNLTLMAFLPLDTWLRLVSWLAVGIVIYLSSGYQHGRVGHEPPRQLQTQGLSLTDAPLSY